MNTTAPEVTLGGFVGSTLLTLVAIFAIGAAYTAATWFAASRARPSVVWIIGWLAIWGLAVGRLTAVGGVQIPPQQPTDWLGILGPLSITLGASALCALYVRRRLRLAQGVGLSLPIILRGAGAFLAGAILGFAPIIVNDLWGLIRQ